MDCPDQAIVHLGSAEATVTLCGCSHQAVLAGAVKKARTVGTMRALQARHADSNDAVRSYRTEGVHLF